MSTVATAPKNKLHPHKFALWVGIGSILMMFAGFTSAYVVKRYQANWTSFEFPVMLWYSTAAILLSSVLLYLAGKAFRERNMARYRSLMLGTLILGLVFIALQVWGFTLLYISGLRYNTTVAYGFLWVIVGAHAVHVIGGVVALYVMAAKAFSSKKRIYSTVPVELISIYWHFVDVLWIYLLVFLLMIR
jgi:cytochrome c oxidase subunit 3